MKTKHLNYYSWSLERRFHPERVKAQEIYDTANLAWFKSTLGTDEAAYLKADAERKLAQVALLKAEAAHPTPHEMSKRNRRQELSSRGLDV